MSKKIDIFSEQDLLKVSSFIFSSSLTKKYFSKGIPANTLVKGSEFIKLFTSNLLIVGMSSKESFIS